MKEVKVSELQEGDLIYFIDSYFIVLSITTIMHPFVKCFMAPTDSPIGIGSRQHIAGRSPILLLCRDGVEV